MSRSAASNGGRMADQGLAGGGDRFGAHDLRRGDPPAAFSDRILDEPRDDAPGELVNDARLFERRIEIVDLAEQSGDEWNGCAELGDRKQAGAQAVVNVVGVVGDVVGDCGGLRLEAGMAPEIEGVPLIVAKDRGRNAARAVSFGRRAGGVKQRAVVFHQPRQGRLGEVEPVEGGVAALEFGHDPQGVAIVVEAAMLGHAGVERVLAGMPERRVAEIVAERDRFGEVVVEPQGPGERARDLRHLDGVGEAGAEMIALVIDEHLGLVGEAAEGRRVDDPVAVALELGARRRRRLGDQAPWRAGRIGGVGRASRRSCLVRRRVP